MSSSKGCAIYFPDGYLGVAPTVANFARTLEGLGYDVTVYGTRNPYPALNASRPSIRIVSVSPAIDIPLGRWVMAALRRTAFRSATLTVDLVAYALQCWLLGSRERRAGSRQVSLVIGVDTIGSVVGSIRAKVAGCPFIYLSLELREPRTALPWSRLVNALERLAYRQSAAVVIQDAERGETLATYLGARHGSTFYVPNSPDDSVPVEADPTANFLRERLGIATSTFPVIALAAGMVGPEVYAEELARSFAALDLDCALVFHERVRRSEDDHYIQRLRAANTSNLFLSLEPVPLDQVDRVYASATIGLAFYRDIDPNFGQIAMASGKLGYYLRHGKPILVSNSPSLARFVTRTGVGIVIDDPSDPNEIGTAMAALRDEYAEYSARARACYEAEFRFDRNIQGLLGLIERVTG